MGGCLGNRGGSDGGVQGRGEAEGRGRGDRAAADAELDGDGGAAGSFGEFNRAATAGVRVHDSGSARAGLLGGGCVLFAVREKGEGLVLLK